MKENKGKPIELAEELLEKVGGGLDNEDWKEIQPTLDDLEKQAKQAKTEEEFYNIWDKIEALIEPFGH